MFWNNLGLEGASFWVGTQGMFTYELNQGIVLNTWTYQPIYIGIGKLSLALHEIVVYAKMLHSR